MKASITVFITSHWLPLIRYSAYTITRHETKFMYSSNQTQDITNSYAQDTTTHINSSLSPTAHTDIGAWLPLRHQWQGQSCSRDLTTVPAFYSDIKIGVAGSSATSTPFLNNKLRHVVEYLAFGSNVVPKQEVSRAATTVVFASARYTVCTVCTVDIEFASEKTEKHYLQWWMTKCSWSYLGLRQMERKGHKISVTGTFVVVWTGHTARNVQCITY